MITYQYRKLAVTFLLFGIFGLAGCGTTKIANNTTATLLTGYPLIAYITHTDNTSPAADTLSTIADITVEPHSVIKLYDVVDTLLPYTVTADGMGHFILEIGDDALSGSVVFITATAPFKLESQPVAIFIP